MVYYYKKKLPNIDDIVIAKVIFISEYGIEVSLIEYNNIKGFINCSEVSRKKKINLNKLLTIGKDILLNVIQIDEIKNLIDLSKRTITDEDIKLFNEKHKIYIQLYNIFKHIYIKLYDIKTPADINDEKLYNFMSATLWKIQDEFENDYLMENLLNKESNFEIIQLINLTSENISQEHFKQTIDQYIDDKINRIKPELNEIIKLITYSSTGLADIKYTLDYKNFIFYNELQKDFDIQIKYISGSNYLLNILQHDFNLTGTILIDNACLMLKKEIKNRATEKLIQNQIII